MNEQTELIATKVMGWRPGNNGYYWTDAAGERVASRQVSILHAQVWDPLTDDAACGQVLDRLAELFEEVKLVKYTDGWWARAHTSGQRPVESAPVALPSRREAIFALALEIAGGVP